MKNLSNEMMDLKNCQSTFKVNILFANDVKDFIKDLKKKILLISKEFEDMETNEASFASGALKSIPYMIDKLAGEKLI